MSAKVECNPASPLTSYHIRIEVCGLPIASFESNTMSPKEILERRLSTDNFPIPLKPQTEDWKYLTIVTESKRMLKDLTITNATVLLLGSGCYHQSFNQETA